MAYAERCEKVRNKEVSELHATNFLRAVNMTFYFVGTRFVAYLTFTAFLLFMDEELTLAQAFTALNLFAELKPIICLFMPQAVRTHDTDSNTQVLVHSIVTHIRLVFSKFGHGSYLIALDWSVCSD